MKVNATELIADLIDKLENLVRENERLKAEIEMQKAMFYLQQNKSDDNNL